MTHGPATGEGLVFSFVGENMGSVFVVWGELTWALYISPQQHGELCCLSGRYTGLGIRQDPGLNTWLYALVLG